jgi:hypothetical protein
MSLEGTSGEKVFAVGSKLDDIQENENEAWNMAGQ